jgi:hypothetical protein
MPFFHSRRFFYLGCPNINGRLALRLIVRKK